MMISFGWDDEVNVVQLSEWLREDAPFRDPRMSGSGVGFLKSITGSGPRGQLWEAWGGWKNPECRIWAGVLNNADIGAVLDKVAAISWRNPEMLQVFLKDQEDFHF